MVSDGHGVRVSAAGGGDVIRRAELPPPLARYLALLGIAEQLLREQVPDDVLGALAHIDDGRQLLIARRHSPAVVDTTARFLAHQAAALIATGRNDVHRSLERALLATGRRLQRTADQELRRLGAAVVTAVQVTITSRSSTPKGQP